MFERFTDRGRRVLVLAQEEARRYGHPYIGTEHLLLGLLCEGEGVAAQVLGSFDITLEAAEDRMSALVVEPAVTIGNQSPPFTPRAKKVLELALREALQLGHSYIGTEHLLLGLVREGEGLGAQVMIGFGAEPDRVRQAVIRLIAGGHDPGLPVSQVSGLSGPGPGSMVVDCSFCGRRSGDGRRFVAGRWAIICEHCVREWAQRLEEDDGGDEGGPPPFLYRPPGEHDADPGDDAQ